MRFFVFVFAFVPDVVAHGDEPDDGTSGQENHGKEENIFLSSHCSAPRKVF